MPGRFSLERQNCSGCFFKTSLCSDACKKPQPILLLTMLSCFWGQPDLSSSLPLHHKHPQQAYTPCFCLDVYVIQDAGIWLKTVSCMYSNTASGRRRESCSLQLLWESPVLLFIWLSFFPFASPISYFIDHSQNSLFPLQAVNLMHAAALLLPAPHFLPSWLWPSQYQSSSWWWSCSTNWLAGIEAFVEMLKPALNMYLFFFFFFPFFLKS